MTFRESITQLLERWDEAIDPGFGRGNPGDGDALPLMPATWNDSYRKLDLLLREMRAGSYRREATHLVARYRDAPVVARKLKVSGGRPVVPTGLEVVAGAASIKAGGSDVFRVRDYRRVVWRFNGRRYELGQPDQGVVDRAFVVLESRWRARWPRVGPMLPDGFLEPMKDAA